MHHLIAATPYSDWERLEPLLNHAGFGEAQEVALEAGHPASGGGPEPKRFLLLHTRPEAALAHAMDRGVSPQDALRQWQSAAEKMLAVFRRDRRGAALIDVECALARPALFLKACERHLGFSVGPWNGQLEAGAVPAALHQVIAAQAVAQSTAIGDLIAELEAASLPIGEPSASPHVDCDRIYDEAHAARERMAEAQRSLQEGSVKPEELQKAEEHNAELEKENELLLLQLHQVQEELESYYLQARAEEEKRAKAERQLENKERKVRYMENSRSWKLTAPMRAMLKRFGGKSGKPGSKTETKTA